MASHIAYRNDSFGDHYTVTLRPPSDMRTPGDVCITRALAIDCPLKLAALVRADGSVAEWYAEWGRTDNTYWHLAHGSDSDATGKHGPIKNLTPAQRETLIRIWGKQVRPFGVAGTCGATVMRWVDPAPGEIEAILGHPVILTAPCGETEAIRQPDDREAGDDRIATREALLEQAVEDGRMAGAAPADI